MTVNWIYKLYLHHFNLFWSCGPQHGQRDVSTVYFPVENQPSVICFLLLSILLILELNGHPVSRRQCHLDEFGHNHTCAAWIYVTLSYRYFKTILTLNDVYIVTKMIYNLYLFIYQCPFKVWSDWNKKENSIELFLTIPKYCSASACAQFSKHSEDGVLISDSPPS